MGSMLLNSRVVGFLFLLFYTFVYVYCLSVDILAEMKDHVDDNLVSSSNVMIK